MYSFRFVIEARSSPFSSNMERYRSYIGEGIKFYHTDGKVRGMRAECLGVSLENLEMCLKLCSFLNLVQNYQNMFDCSYMDIYLSDMKAVIVFFAGVH